MKELETFVYDGDDAAHPVRVVMRDGKPWFVVKDVCAILGIEQATRAVEPLDDDEKAAVSLTHTSSTGTEQSREMLIISEGGLYTLTLRSRQAVTFGTPAHRFRKWVTGELLPMIRAEGRFGPNDPTAGWDWQVIREKLQMVREVRLTVGRQAAAMLYETLGLPLPDKVERKPPASMQGIDFVQQFLNERCVEDSTAQVQAARMYEAYCGWAKADGAPSITQTAFGNILTALGINKRRGAVVTYSGWRIRHPEEVAG